MLRKNRTRNLQEAYRRTATRGAVRHRDRTHSLDPISPRSYARIWVERQGVVRRGRSAASRSGAAGGRAVARTGSRNGDKATQPGRPARRHRLQHTVYISYPGPGSAGHPGSKSTDVANENSHECSNSSGSPARGSAFAGGGIGEETFGTCFLSGSTLFRPDRSASVGCAGHYRL